MNEKGQGIFEFCLIIVLIAVVVMAAIQIMSML
jgi:Flp pilus assembly pilin Flp